MSLQSLINRPVVILTRSDSGEIDEAGDEVLDEVAVQTVGEIQPNDTSEPSQHPDIADSDWVGFFLNDDFANLNSASLVWVPDEGEFEIEGEPLRWRNPRTQSFEYVAVGLNRVAGASDSEGS